jgi:hypothetical protein
MAFTTSMLSISTHWQMSILLFSLMVPLPTMILRNTLLGGSFFKDHLSFKSEISFTELLEAIAISSITLGLLLGVDINCGKIVTQFAMESGPLAEQTNALLTNGAGGEAGIWMSGMGIASDGDRIFVVTGNGAVSLLDLCDFY